MVNLTADYIMSNKSKWKKALKVNPVLIEKIHLEKFNGRSKLSISTVDGMFELRKKDYLDYLKVSSGNTLYILYNVSINSFSKEEKKVKRKFITNDINDEKVLDRFILNQNELNSAGYKKYKYGTYNKASRKEIKVFMLNEDVILVRKGFESLKGKSGDIVLINDNNNYTIVSKNYFMDNYQFIS